MDSVNLIHGDCLEKMKDIPDGSVDLVLCDPPYGITARNEWDIPIPFEPMWKEYNRIIKDNGAILLFGAGKFGIKLVMSNIEYYRYDLIWEKGNAQGFLNANRMPLRAHENIYVFYKKLPTYNPQKTEGTPYSRPHGKGTLNYSYYKSIKTNNQTGRRYPRSVLRYSNSNHAEKQVSTQKPVSLLEYLIKTYTNPGEVVLDNCMGSGSTGVACINTGRQFIGIEKDKDIFEIAKTRINEHLKEKATV